MKLPFLITICALAFATPALSADAPKHGGIVAETKELDLELVARPDLLQLHVRGHDGKALDVSKASAKVTLLTGSEKQEVELKPAGALLEAKGAYKVEKGTKAVAVVRGVGKGEVTGRFAIK